MKRSLYIFFFLGVLNQLYSQNLLLHPTSDQTDTSIELINPVSITASVNPRLATDNPYSVQVISSKTIKNMAAQSLNEVLNNQSSIILSNDPNLGSAVKLQGLGGQNVKILINGIPMVGRLNGNIDVSQIPTESIDRIEIVEGPMSVVYGTDAIGGVINIITKNPTSNSNTYFAKTYFDGAKNYNQDAGLKFFYRKNQWLDFNIGRQFFEGFDFNTDNRMVDWKPKIKWFGNTGWGYKTKNLNHKVTLNYFREKLTDRSNAEYNLIGVTGYNNYFYTQRADIGYIIDFKLNATNNFRFQNAFNTYQRQKINVRRNLVTGSEVVTRPSDQDTTLNTLLNLRGLWENNALKKYIFMAGYDIQRETISGQRIQSVIPIWDAALFGSIEYKPSSKVNIKPSLRLAYNNTFGTPIFTEVLNQKFRIAPIIPSLQLKYQISKFTQFRASYARGFRAPTAKELYFLFVDINHNVQGNQNLRAENSHNFIASLDYRHTINKNLAAQFKLSSFYNLINNQIQLSLVDVNSALYQYTNIGEMTSSGVNISSEFYVNEATFTWNSSYLQNYARVNADDGLQQWSVMQHTLNIQYPLKKYNTNILWFSRFSGKTQGFTTTGDLYSLPSYTLADLSLSHTLPSNQLMKKAQIQWGLKNLFNVTQLLASAQTGGIHSNNNGGVNLGMGRIYFVQLTVNL